MRDTRDDRNARPEGGDTQATLPPTERRHEVTATMFRPELWDRIAEDVIEIEELCFSGKLGPEERRFVSEWRERFFTDPDHRVSLLLSSDGRLVGFALAECGDDPAHVKDVAVHPDFQGKGLVGGLMSVLEDELRSLGYERAKIEAVMSNGYADKICRAYGRRIVDYFEDSKHAHIIYEL